MNKKWNVFLIAALIATTTIPSMANGNVDTEFTETTYVECELLNDEAGDFELIDWAAELEYFKEFVSTEDYKELEKLIKEVAPLEEAPLEEAPLEEAENFDEADKVWDEIDNILTSYEDEMMENEELTTPAFYTIENGTLVLSNDANDYADGEVKEVTEEQQELHQKLWKRVGEIIPKDYMDMIVAFDLTTDGFGGMSASVMTDEDQETKWIFNYDPADVVDDNGKYDQALIDETMIHEFAHILTLNNTQLMDESNLQSSNYSTDEGTLKKNSYLNAFYQEFWKDIAKEYEIKNEEGREEYDVEKLYSDKENDFVTDYAATNPAEDIAESFAFFVTKSKPSNDKGKNAKINFFYDYPELVKMRDDIRSGIGNKK